MNRLASGIARAGIVGIASLVVVGFAGCEQKSDVEKAAERTGEAVKDAGAAVEDAAAKTGDAINDAAKKLEN